MKTTFNQSRSTTPQLDFTSSGTLSKALTKTMTRRGIQNQRISFTTVRTCLGNEMTDYHLDYQEGENLAEIDFTGWSPLHKYFGRFIGDAFTGIKYNYGLSLGKEKISKYVESIIEYRNGTVNGEQIYFNTEGDVVRKIYLDTNAYANSMAMQTA